MKDKLGVFLGRFQPLHNGHIAIIDKMLENHKEILILIGSADKLFTLRNPLLGGTRLNIIETYFRRKQYTGYPDIKRDKNGKKKGFVFKTFTEIGEYRTIRVQLLDDLTNEGDNCIEWGDYLKTKIFDSTDKNKCVIYYSDNPEIMKSWFSKDALDNDSISFNFLKRDKIEDGMSATKIREAMMFLNQSCPNVVTDTVTTKIGEICNSVRRKGREK